ncbi:MAG: phage holin family protein [Tuberibacillus sp.]
MKNWLIHIVVITVVLMAVDGYMDSIKLDGFWAALAAGVILSVLNVIVKPLLILFTLPVTVLSLGLFLFVINAITLSLTAWLMGDAFEINGFGSALLAAVIISVLNLLIQTFIVKPLKKKK